MTAPVPRGPNLEELTLNAWPAPQRILFDGWVLNFARGYTRRANSIWPLYPSSLPLGAKIEACEAIYAARSQPVIFKLTSQSVHAELDAELARRGYLAEAETSVQTAALDGQPATDDAAVRLTTDLQDGWLDDFGRLSGTSAHVRPAMASLLATIAPDHVFASLAAGHDQGAAGVGLAVAERGSVGLFDIVVDAAVRNQGLGRRIVSALLDWGRTRGAERAYLAVVSDNQPARHLYARLGFAEVYTYWYRRRTAPDGG